MFIAEVKKQLYLKQWNHKDLAKATGYKLNTIDAFMCGARQSEKVAVAIATALGIER